MIEVDPDLHNPDEPAEYPTDVSQLPAPCLIRLKHAHKYFAI